MSDELAGRLDSIRTDLAGELGWDTGRDRASAEELARLAPRPAGVWRHLGTELKHRGHVAVVGCGPSLLDLKPADVAGAIVIAADGAVARLEEIGVPARVVVTDLDGDADALMRAAASGSIMVVHAHGDNRDAMTDLVPVLGPLVAGTHQVGDQEIGPVRPIHGITDGDRAAVLAHGYGARQISLHGFDLEAEPSQYSGTWDAATKPRKLAAAADVLAALRGAGAPLA